MDAYVVKKGRAIEDFDYEECYKEYMANVKKPNILICGASGVGKSSMINTVFDMEIAKVGKDGIPQKIGDEKIRRYAPEEEDLVIYDSEGYEITDSSGNEAYLKDIIGLIQQKKKNYPTEFDKHIHEVWYVIHNRFTKFDEEIVRAAIKNLVDDGKHVPLMIIISKVDTLDSIDVEQIKSDINTVFPDLSVFTFSSVIPKDNKDYLKYVQVREIRQWAYDNLDVSLQSNFIPCLKMNVADIRKSVLKTTIPLYTGLAATSVVAIAATGVPVADAVGLMTIQTKMTVDILKAYNIGGNIGDVVKGAVGAGIMGFLGKTAASQIIGLLPAIGGAAKAAINTGIAATFTATLGSAITFVCEQYLRACIDRNGKDNLPDFAKYFTAENIRAAMKAVKKDNTYNIDQIVDVAISEKEKNVNGSKNG